MDNDFIGPFCEEINLTKQAILEINSIKPLVNQTLKNGLLFELESFCKNLNKVIDILKILQPELSSTNLSSLKTKINRLVETKKKLVSKKKVNGVSSVNELKSKPFSTPSQKLSKPSKKLFVSPLEQSFTSPKECLFSESYVISPRQADADLKTNEKHVSTEQNIKEDDVENMKNTFNKDERRTLNSFEYELNKKKKALNRTTKELELLNEKIKSQQAKIGHYAVRNVNKRDETARKNVRLLRETERQLMRQKQISAKDAETIECLTKECKTIKEQQNINQESKTKLIEQKKIQAQKTASYYKVTATSLRHKIKENLIENDALKSQKSKICELETKIQNLEINNDILKEQINENKCETKHRDGTFTDSMRLCVIELSGLEVAVEKVPNVIKTVSKHLFKTEFNVKDLPSSTTVQTIVDEGHFLAKTFISQKLSETENWGLSRDGTTRRKQKILDTSLTLSTGNVISLGFSRVAHETAETINNVTKNHLNELATLNANISSKSEAGNYVKMSLEKLAYTMSDRASNEKKADRLLDEWRDNFLGVCEEKEHSEVLHFHCMAHVLLGFHRYICLDLKDLESSLSAEYGPLGRDSLPIFRFWKTKGTIVERVLRTVSEVFGPAGDHHGVRDLWEAHCSTYGIKSVIGNYKDNRFNALFQTAAEVCLHHEDFIKVLEGVKTPNLKIKSVLADIKSETVMAMIRCLGLFYMKITGPYWNLLISHKVPYLELHSEIKELKNFLKECFKEPTLMFNLDSHWSKDDPHGITDLTYGQLLKRKLSESDVPVQKIVLTTVQKVSSAMTRTIETQLVDFLPNGKFSAEPTEDNLKKTSFAHVTNLACEHHFGDLDSSQRRRPSASMHHHSSIQLLKRNREQLVGWINEMPPGQQKEILKEARKGGKALRQSHITQEKNVLREISEEMMNVKAKKNKKRKVNNSTENLTKKHRRNKDESLQEEQNSDEEELLKELPNCENIKENEYVAVAYQDMWYPGIITSLHSNKSFLVCFMSPTRKAGYFCWPLREDIQTVEKEFILKTGFVPNCVNSGRMWNIDEQKEIDLLYKKFKKFYF